MIMTTQPTIKRAMRSGVILYSLVLTLLPKSALAEDRWVAILRDAQLANRTALNQGHARMYLECRPDVSKKQEPAIIEVEIAWRGRRYANKMRMRDPQGVMSGGEKKAGPLENQPWELRLMDEKNYYVFNPVTHTLFIHPATTFDNPYFQLYPLDAWLGTSPDAPLPVVDVIGSFRQPRGKKPSTFEFMRVGNNIIRQVRHDAYSSAEGGVSEMDFDLAQCGNLVRTKYTLPQSKEPIEEGHYRWRKLGTASVLVSSTHTTIIPDRRGSRQTQEISLQVRDVNLRGEPESYFTKDHLIKELPLDTLIDDRVQNRRYKLHPERKVREQDSNDASDLLKSRGFLKK